MSFKTSKDKLAPLWELVCSVWRSGVLRVAPQDWLPILAARWRCGNSFALLSTVASIRFGSRLALQDDEGCLTFSQLHHQSLALARKLSLDHGVGPGSQVALMGRNHRSFVLGLLACTRLGADVLPLAADLPAVVMETILARQRISLLLHEPGLENVGALSSHLVCTVPCRTVESDAPEPPRVPRGGELIVLTSGTSGISKGIRRRPTIRQVLPLVAGLLQAIPIKMHRPIVLAIPLYHGYGIATLAMALTLGAPLQLGRRYEIAKLLDRLEPAERPFLVTVPTLLSRWMRTFPTDVLPQAIITGSAPLEATLCSALLEALGPVLYNLYGSTEAGLIALASPRTLIQAPGAVGLPLPGNEVRLLDPEGQRVEEAGQLGRIFVKGPFVLPSTRDVQASCLSEWGEGWRETGDLGRLDASGNLFVCGRADTMIVSGGENVYPQEIEEALLGHPEVVEVAVLAVDDAEFGRRLLAVVAPRADGSLEEEVLREWLKKRLERHKIPRSIRFLDSLPRNALGKINRLALEKLLQPGSDPSSSP